MGLSNLLEDRSRRGNITPFAGLVHALPHYVPVAENLLGAVGILLANTLWQGFWASSAGSPNL